MKRLIRSLIVAGLGFTLWPAVADAQQPITLRLGHSAAPGSTHDIAATRFAKEVNEALEGRVEVRVFHSSQLGTDEQMVKGIRVGTPEMSLPGTVMSTVEPRFGVFEMPYIIVNRSHMKRVAENRDFQRMVFEDLPAKGMRVLGVWENGFRHVTNNVRPVVKPEDLKGIRLRVPSGVWRVKMFQAYGATPSAMAFSEVYLALRSGAMDGQENPLAQIWSAKLHEVQKYLSMTGHVYTPAYLLVSEEVWQKLPRDVQATIARIARDLGDFARAEGERLDRELVGKLAPPMQANEVDKEAFIKGSAAVYEQFGREVPGGTELIRLIQRLREASQLSDRQK